MKAQPSATVLFVVGFFTALPAAQTTPFASSNAPSPISAMR